MPATFADSWLVAVPFVVTLAICMAFLAKVPAIARLGPLQGFLLMLVIFGVGTFAVRSGLETVGAQMRELRVFEDKSQMGRRLNIRHNLYEPLERVIDNLL